MIWGAVRSVLAYFAFLDTDPCDPSAAHGPCQDCYAESLGVAQPTCLHSGKACGHHCECSWVSSVCCWCSS